MAETNEAHDPLPEQFETFEALADFWDTHAVTEYAEFLTPVEFEVTAKPTHEYVITLSDSLNALLSKVEKREGVPMKTLINLWVQEKLQQYQTASV